MASSSSTLCQANVTYKKQPGQLTLTKTRLTFSTSSNQPPIVSVPNNRMTVLFASKEGAAKVALKIALAPETPTSVGEESYNFQFTAGSSAVSDRERFKKELSTFIAHNRESTVTTAVSNGTGDDTDVKPDLNQLAAAMASADKGKGKATLQATGSQSGSGTVTPTTANKSTNPNPVAGPQATSDFHLRKLVLQAHPALMSLHRDLVMSRQISEQEFWAGREDLLAAARAAEQQLRGKSGGMVDPKPETDDKGDVTVKITPQLIVDIFAEYPAVLRAYNDNVPDPLDEQQFWTRYFQSKLFNRNRTANRAAVNTVKDDPIFDKYLGEEDDDIEPKNLQHHEIYRLLDLAATEEDQHEVTNQGDITMRPGRERAALPLMRRFNEHSERLLNQSLGNSVDRSRISFNPGNAGERNESAYYESDILLSDLLNSAQDDRIQLNLQQHHGTKPGSQQQEQNGSSKRKAGEEAVSELESAIQRRKIIREIQDVFDEAWEPRLESFELEALAVDDAMEDMMLAVKHKADRAARESGTSNGIHRATLQSCYQVEATSTEFLRLFWRAVLPPAPNDLSALALSSPVERAARAERFKGCLDNSVVRIKTVISGSGLPTTTTGGSGSGAATARSRDEQRRIEAALEPVRLAVEHALQFYKSRTQAAPNPTPIPATMKRKSTSGPAS